MPNAEQISEVPNQVATVLPTGVSHTQAIVNSLQTNISEIKSDIRILLGAFIAGFLLLATGLGAIYVRMDDKITRSDDKIDRLSQTVIRSDTKLEDLLQRIPPVVATPPKR